MFKDVKKEIAWTALVSSLLAIAATIYLWLASWSSPAFYIPGLIMFPVMVWGVTWWLRVVKDPPEPFSEAISGGILLGLFGVGIWPAVPVGVLLVTFVTLWSRRSSGSGKAPGRRLVHAIVAVAQKRWSSWNSMRANYQAWKDSPGWRSRMETIFMRGMTVAVICFFSGLGLLIFGGSSRLWSS